MKRKVARNPVVHLRHGRAATRTKKRVVKKNPTRPEVWSNSLTRYEIQVKDGGAWKSYGTFAHKLQAVMLANLIRDKLNKTVRLLDHKK